MLDPQLLFWTLAAFAFLFGTLIGSFLNVVIYRLPEGLSVVSPRSRCPSCKTEISWYDNIPIVSWLLLGGKCRSCKAPISVRYALVEALTGGLALAAWYHSGVGLLRVDYLPDQQILIGVAVTFFLKFTFLALLVAITFIDLDHYIIPHELTLPGIVLGIASPWIGIWLWGPASHLRIWPPVSPTVSLAGALAGFLSIIAIYYLYLAWRGVEGIGGGDATLMAMVGAWLGWPALIFVFFAASLQGVFAAGVGMVLGNRFVRDYDDIYDDETVDESPEEEEAGDEEAAVASELGPVQPVIDEPVIHEPVNDEPVNDEPADSSTLGELPDLEMEQDEVVHSGKLAVPFGPFISLAAVEFFLLGPWLPNELTMVYLYW